MATHDPTTEVHTQQGDTMASDVQTFEFQKEHDGSVDLRSAVFQALGAASMCWTETPSGVFESERAQAIGDALMGFIRWQELALGKALAIVGPVENIFLGPCIITHYDTVEELFEDFGESEPPRHDMGDIGAV